MPSPSPLAGEGGARPATPGGRERARCRHKELQDRAKLMRGNPTPAEQRLWSMLRDKRLPVFKFRRQLLIEPYIVDFICLERRLIIEADGSHHIDSDYDRRRDSFLAAEGFTVLRLFNHEILEEPSAVFDAIAAALASPHPSAAAGGSLPLPQGERGSRISR